MLHATTSHPGIRLAVEYLSRSFLFGNSSYFILLSCAGPMNALGLTRALGRDSHRDRESTVDIRQQWTGLPPLFMSASVFTYRERFFLSIASWRGRLGTLRLCQGISSICCKHPPDGSLSVQVRGRQANAFIGWQLHCIYKV